MDLMPASLRDTLLANAAHSARDENFDPHPAVKYFTPDAGGTWLITEAERDGDDLILFGLCDLGVGCPELGPVLLSELEALRGSLGLPVERDLGFRAHSPLSGYAREAIAAGRIMV